MTKTRLACVMNIKSLADSPDARLYLWTFTFPEVLDLDVARRLWSRLARALRRRGVVLVRVFEFHPGGHGLHVHAVTAQRLDATMMWKLAARYGFGRVDVRVRTRDRCTYVAKYLCKQKRPECAKGLRLWDVVGVESPTRVSQLICLGVQATAIRAALAGGAKFSAACVEGFNAWVRWVFSDAPSPTG